MKLSYAAEAMATAKFTGKVVKKRLSRGSKSERDALVLEAKDGELVLRRRGGNPFHDEVLDRLVGKRIQCSGIRSGNLVILTDWTEDPD